MIKSPMKERLTTDQFITVAQTKYNNRFDYSLATYHNNKTKIKIICRECNNIFEQTPNKHLTGKINCPNCWSNSRQHNSENMRIKAAASFVNRAIAIGYNSTKYSYNKVKYITCDIKVEIWCNQCDVPFWQAPRDHLRGKGCPVCRESKGETSVAKWLDEHKVTFIRQYVIKEFNQRKFFDFYLPVQDLLIEYDGIQHFKAMGSWAKTYPTTIKRDSVTNKWCEENHHKLLRLSYNEKWQDKLFNAIGAI